MLGPPPPPFPPSRKSDEELARGIDSYLRRKSIIERRLMDAPSPLILMRLTDGQPLPMDLAGLNMNVDIEDSLATCFFCRADGWLGKGQVPLAGTRLCLNCYATMVAMGYVHPEHSRSTVMIADRAVPKRPRPKPRQ